MKIEIWYDPVYTEMGICLNGYWQDKNDIYSFLYPVRNYPLQTWLEEMGSWQGISRQLADISKGEELELDFYGRKVDYEDLDRVLKDSGGIKRTFYRWEAMEYYEGIMQKTKRVPTELRLNEMSERELAESYEKALNAGCSEKWYCDVRTKEDLLAAERSEIPCVVVHESMLVSYSDLAQLERLSRSLRRPMDAILCVIENSEKCREFARYAAQFPRLRFEFADSGHKDRLGGLKEKYGKPYILRQQQAQCLKAVDVLLEFLSERSTVNSQRLKLIHRRQDGIMTEAEEERLEQVNERIRWMNQSENAIRALRERLLGHVISEKEKEYEGNGSNGYK